MNDHGKKPLIASQFTWLRTPAGVKLPIKVVFVRQTCVEAPSQFEGRTKEGDVVYARFRGGVLTVRMASTLKKALDSEPIVEGASTKSSMTYEELRERTVGLVRWPETCEPYGSGIGNK